MHCSGCTRMKCSGVGGDALYSGCTGVKCRASISEMHSMSTFIFMDRSTVLAASRDM